jgi:hypothetical protein
VKFGEICQKEVTPSLTRIWVEQLSDIPADLLDRACDRLAKTWTSGFLPTPGNVGAQIEKADSAGLELEAARAWELYLGHVTSYYHPDLGWDRRAPRLDAITEHAGSIAGRAHWIEGCPESELQWCRKRFLDAYTLAHNTGQVEHLLTRGEAKKILATLTSEAPAKQLQPPAQFRQPQPGPSKPDSAALRAFDDLREKLNAPEPRTAACPPQRLDERLAELQRQAEEVKTKYGFQEAAP